MYAIRTLAATARGPADPVNGRVAWKVLELYNERTRRVALETGAHLIDLAREMPKTSRFYYDFLHFSNAGARRVAAILFDRLCPYLQRTFPGHAEAPCRRDSP